MLARAFPIVPALFAALVAAPDPALGHRYVPPPVPGANVQLVCDWGCSEIVHHGQRYVVAEYGRRYAVSVSNPSDRWVEAVITVDGRDVLDGHRASSRSRGYLIPPYDQIRIEGWRTSRSEVAAFRFTGAGDSYAGRVGDTRDMGTVRVAIFPEQRRREWIPSPAPEPFDTSERDDASPRKKAAPEAASGEERHADGLWRRRNEQNLGTEFGEARWQPVQERDFVREDAQRPAQTITLRYDDREGLRAKGVLPPPVSWDWDRDRHDHWVTPPPDR